MKPQDKFGSSFETAKELPETSWKRKTIQAASAASSQAEAIGKSGGFQGSALSTPVDLREKLEAFLLSLGVSDVGFSKPEAEGLEKTPYAVTLVVRLSSAIVDEIEGEPTLTYFSHYRAVNAFLDQCLLKPGFVRVEVIDHGEGIEPEKLELIWDRYYKVDKTHRRAVVGTGLGLSIVKSVLEMHNAKYGVESAVGEGSTFWFELPLPEYLAQIDESQQQ